MCLPKIVAQASVANNKNSNKYILLKKIKNKKLQIANTNTKNNK